ncbi:hypothetical protein SPI_02791 [Niveomyces insectorum RCEF 264]|uniref:MOZ protein represents a chromatin-associated acetyltransferase n=1 Tax=Niveomyces insectorum RCEF 264 TaxID=1081102 RepID=A0A167Y967_9HYPO|nr:hypothetical protein SPI_02791 [Niveomyces insectorum RCEF 264]
MPGARPLRLRAAAPAQQLQLLRGAASTTTAAATAAAMNLATTATTTTTTATTAATTFTPSPQATMTTTRPGASRRADGPGDATTAYKYTRAPPSSTASTRPCWCAVAARRGHYWTPLSPSAARLLPSATTMPARRARLHSLPLGGGSGGGGGSGPSVAATATAAFGTATLAKQTSFPRHGKAVAPQQDTPGHAAAEATAAAPPEASATGGQRPVKTNGKRGRAAERREEKTPAEAQAQAAGGAPTAQAASTVSAAATLGPPSPTVDAQRELGTRAGGLPPGAKATDAAAVAADAAASAAEAASVASSVARDLEPVVEFGAPPSTIGTILGPDVDGAASVADADANRSETATTDGGGAHAADEATTTTTTAANGTEGQPARQPLSQKPPPPHLTPPPYVHHFDSYSLVRQLAADPGGGYTPGQAITAMKAVRGLLALHLEFAQANLVSKSDVENEAYLFKAACAELSIEVRNNRRRADEQMRQQRTLLQHEVDIAAQSVSQELVALNDVVRGLFNDRKMAVREEQKALDSAIQQLNYKITIMLNSEMRSDIESVRWVLIRRSVLGIIFLAILTLGTLRYASYLSHEKAKKEAAAAAAAAEEREAGLRGNGSGHNHNHSSDAGGGRGGSGAPPADAAEFLATS